MQTARTRQATWAIVPVKALDDAKQRLASVLPPHARAHLVATMLEDVLGTLARVRGLVRTLVVTPDARVDAIARACGAQVLREGRAIGLNIAVRAGIAHAREHGAERVLVLPADVPSATASEVESVLAPMLEPGASAGRARVALVPAGDGDGTNALLLSPPDALEPAFGPGSFVRHLANAVARRLDSQVLQLVGLGADVDTPADLAGLAAAPRYAFLRAHLPEADRTRHQTGEERAP